MFYCTLLLCVLAVVINGKIIEEDMSIKPINYDLSNAAELFEEFLEKYNKKYDEKESVYRFNIFKENLAKIVNWNDERNEAVFEITEFSDLTFEEFSYSYTGLNGNWSLENQILYKPTGYAPSSIDWRDSGYVTPVKNQETCGSCYIFSAIGNVEGQYAKKYGSLLSLSEQQVLDCDSIDNKCSGGLPDNVFQYLAQSGGAMLEDEYRYNHHPGQCRFDQSRIAVKVKGGQQFSVNEEDLADAVANLGPLSIGIIVGQEMQQLGKNTIYKPKDCGDSGHAVLLIGYGTEGNDKYWLIKNSWGAGWGDDGYYRMIRGESACGIGAYVANSEVA